MFRKKTHTEQYLHATSHHFPVQKIVVLNTLATRALRVSDENHMEDEKSHLLEVFEKNKGPPIKKSHYEYSLNVLLPFIHGTTDKIARVLKRNNVFATFKPLNTIKISLRFVKDPVNPKDMKGVYAIPCSCVIPYIGETGHSINLRIREHANLRIREHAADIRLNRSLSLVVAKHAEKTKLAPCLH